MEAVSSSGGRLVVQGQGSADLSRVWKVLAAGLPAVFPLLLAALSLELHSHSASVGRIRLGRMLVALTPDEPGVYALLTLMSFHDSRREARTGPDDELVVLDQQDRSRWDQPVSAEGLKLLEHSARMRGLQPASSYELEAARIPSLRSG